MKSIGTILSIPQPETVIVEYKGKKYTAIESDIRWLQLKVSKGDFNPKNIKVFDIDTNGGVYELIFRKDGRFENEFTSNIMRLNSFLTMDLITGGKISDKL